jgi:hypothetical protein
MSYKGLRDFINLDEVKKRLEKVKIHELQGKEKLAVETFLRDFDSRDKNIDFD